VLPWPAPVPPLRVGSGLMKLPIPGIGRNRCRNICSRQRLNPRIGPRRVDCFKERVALIGAPWARTGGAVKVVKIGFAQTVGWLECQGGFRLIGRPAQAEVFFFFFSFGK